MFSIEVLVGFHLFILAMLMLDLGVFNKKPHHIGIRESIIWSGVWVALALAFDVVLYCIWPNREEAHDKAILFLTCYIMEKSMSLDNLFVFTVIFGYFGVPDRLKHKVLYWGILGAFFFRGALIGAGAVSIGYVHYLIYPLALFLFYVAYKLFTAGDDEPTDPSKNWLLNLARKHLNVVTDYDTDRFWVRRSGILFATPLLLVLLVVESTDVLFATDSIPAMLGITNDWFIIYTSNIFAILGLRSLFFLISNFLDFRFLNPGLGTIMAFVASKIMLEDFVQIGTFTSCLVILGILVTAVVASLIWPSKEESPVPVPVTVEKK
jgi:tellurite resistance protein TerC